MEVKPGYKKTEVGVIPEEWDVKTLGSLTTLLTNGFVGTATTAYVEGDDGILYIQGYNVQENGFNFHGIKRVSKAFHARNKKSSLQLGDLLTIQTGDIGVTTVVPPELVGANCHALIISRLRKQESEPGYFCQYFNSERGRVAFKKIETGTTMKHLNGGDMKRLFLPCPPVEEQCAIAEALSDVDGMLGGLDRLIAKKRDLKAAAMHQLLTDQTRLPGFHGDWEDTKVQDVIAGFFCGPSPNCEERNIEGDEEWGVLKTTAATKENGWDWRKHKTLPKVFWHRPHLELKKGDVIVTKAGPRHRVGVAAWVDFVPSRIIVSGKMIGLRPRLDKVDPLMLTAAISAREAQAYLDQRTTGMAESQVNFENTALVEAPIRIPCIEEQTAIAKVLTDMDAELAALEQRREKTRALKQAMMQELLTGRTRLI